MPTAVSRLMAIKPSASTTRVWARRNLSASIVAPMQSPRSSVTILAISFSEALFKRSTTPHSFMRLPSITVPISGAPLGARIEAKIVTTIGNMIFVVCDIGCFTAPITIVRSLSVVRARMIGG